MFEWAKMNLQINEGMLSWKHVFAIFSEMVPNGDIDHQRVNSNKHFFVNDL